MAGAAAGVGEGPEGPEALGEAGAVAPGHRDWRDWAGGVPEHVLVKVAGTLIAQDEAAAEARLKRANPGLTEGQIQEVMEERERDGNCLFVFARVCKEWRKAQLKVGGPLRTRVPSDVLLPGRVELAKWALAEGCPRKSERDYTMAAVAATYGHLELVKWLCGEGGFAMDVTVMWRAARGGNLELVQWLRGVGCPWDWMTCQMAVFSGHVEVLRWARENDCCWTEETRDRAFNELGYEDEYFGNLVDDEGHPIDEEGDRIDEEGNKLDSCGNPIKINKEGDRIDDAGYLLNEYGDRIDEYGNRIYEFFDDEGNQVDEEGNRIFSEDEEESDDDEDEEESDDDEDEEESDDDEDEW